MIQFRRLVLVAFAWVYGTMMAFSQAPASDYSDYRLLRDLAPSGAVSIIQSPVDSSYWLATAGDGLVRVGRNGRRVVYSVASGHLPCDSLSSLALREDGAILIYDRRGHVLSYSSVAGFQPVSGDIVSLPAETSSGDASAAAPVSVTNDSLFLKHSNSIPTPVNQHINSRSLPIWLILLAVLFFIGMVVSYLLFLRERRFNSLQLETRALSDPSSFARTSMQASHPAFSSPPVEPHGIPSSPAPVQTPSPSPSFPPPASPASVSASPVPGGRTSAFSDQVNRLIADHISDASFGVEELSDALGITRVHLNRKLKAAGMDAPSSLLKSARMKKAAALLLSDAGTVSEIALQCGFSTQSYFSTAFRDFYGQTPSEYVASHSSS